MKIKRFDNSHISIGFSYDHPWFEGTILIVVALLAAITFSDRFSIDCIRNTNDQGLCTLIQQTFFTRDEQTIPLASLHSASVEYGRDAGGKQTTQQLILLADQGNIPISGNYILISRSVLADKINTFIGDANQKTFAINRDNRFVAYPLAALAVFLGVFLITTNHKVLLDLDRSKGLATIHRTVKSKTTTEEIKLGDLVHATLDTRSIGGIKTHRVALVHRKKKLTPLTETYTSGRRKKQKMIKAIDQFLSS